MHLFPGFRKINCLKRNNVENTDVLDVPTTNTTNIDESTTASAPLEEQSKNIYILYTFIYLYICICTHACTRYPIYIF